MFISGFLAEEISVEVHPEGSPEILEAQEISANKGTPFVFIRGKVWKLLSYNINKMMGRRAEYIAICSFASMHMEIYSECFCSTSKFPRRWEV